MDNRPIASKQYIGTINPWYSLEKGASTFGYSDRRSFRRAIQATPPLGLVTEGSAIRSSHHSGYGAGTIYHHEWTTALLPQGITSVQASVLQGTGAVDMRQCLNGHRPHVHLRSTGGPIVVRLGVAFDPPEEP